MFVSRVENLENILYRITPLAGVETKSQIVHWSNGWLLNSLCHAHHASCQESYAIHGDSVSTPTTYSAWPTAAILMLVDTLCYTFPWHRHTCACKRVCSGVIFFIFCWQHMISAVVSRLFAWPAAEQGKEVCKVHASWVAGSIVIVRCLLVAAQLRHVSSAGGHS